MYTLSANHNLQASYFSSVFSEACDFKKIMQAAVLSNNAFQGASCAKKSNKRRGSGIKIIIHIKPQRQE